MAFKHQPRLYRFCFEIVQQLNHKPNMQFWSQMFISSSYLGPGTFFLRFWFVGINHFLWLLVVIYIWYRTFCVLTMVELQSCASLVNASALCSIEQEVKGEATVNIIAEISAELQREREKNAELMERISVLESQIQEREKESFISHPQVWIWSRPYHIRVFASSFLASLWTIYGTATSSSTHFDSNNVGLISLLDAIDVFDDLMSQWFHWRTLLVKYNTTNFRTSANVYFP